MKKILFFTVLTAACLSGCVVVNFSEYDAVTGKGDLEKYDFKVSEYSGIKIEGLCDINYHAASSDTVTLEVQPNLREYFVVEVVGNDLIVRTTRRVSFNSNRSPVLTVSTPVLNRLEIKGAGIFTAHDKITADSFALKLEGAGKGKAELDVNSLTVDMSGAGSFVFSGRADTAGMDLSGAGELNALSLQTREAKVSLSGAGKVRISCTEILSINADGMGSVEYIGSPSLNLNRSGLVSIRKLD